MTGGVSHFEALAAAVRDVARATAAGVLQVRARGARPATATHLGTDIAVVALHALAPGRVAAVLAVEAALVGLFALYWVLETVETWRREASGPDATTATTPVGRWPS